MRVVFAQSMTTIGVLLTAMAPVSAVHAAMDVCFDESKLIDDSEGSGESEANKTSNGLRATDFSQGEDNDTTQLLFVWTRANGLELAADLNYIAAAAGNSPADSLRKLRLPGPVRFIGRCWDIFDYLTVPYSYYACVEEEKEELDRCTRVVAQVHNTCIQIARNNEKRDPCGTDLAAEFAKCREQSQKDSDACFDDYYASIGICSTEFVVDAMPFEVQAPAEILVWTCNHPEFF